MRANQRPFEFESLACIDTLCAAAPRNRWYYDTNRKQYDCSGRSRLLTGRRDVVAVLSGQGRGAPSSPSPEIGTSNAHEKTRTRHWSYAGGLERLIVLASQSPKTDQESEYE